MTDNALLEHLLEEERRRRREHEARQLREDAERAGIKLRATRVAKGILRSWGLPLAAAGYGVLTQLSMMDPALYFVMAAAAKYGGAAILFRDAGKSLAAEAEEVAKNDAIEAGHKLLLTSTAGVEEDPYSGSERRGASSEGSPQG